MVGSPRFSALGSKHWNKMILILIKSRWYMKFLCYISLSTITLFLYSIWTKKKKSEGIERRTCEFYLEENAWILNSKTQLNRLETMYHEASLLSLSLSLALSLSLIASTHSWNLKILIVVIPKIFLGSYLLCDPRSLYFK